MPIDSWREVDIDLQKKNWAPCTDYGLSIGMNLTR